MTEIIERPAGETPRLGPFLAALILAPLCIALPFAALLWLGAATKSGGLTLIAALPVAGTVLGAPTYLTFGAAAFWIGLRRGTDALLMGLLANIVSLPFVLGYFVLTSGPSTAAPALQMFGLLGSVFAMVWGATFQGIYHRFTKGGTSAGPSGEG